MSYQNLNSICQSFELPVSAAEIHGIACAMLCANGQTQGVDWLDKINTHESQIIDEEREALLGLFELTRRFLFADDFSFALLLPEDDSALHEQAEALSEWCKGFVFGIGLTHKQEDLTEDCLEILKDLIEFCKMDTLVEDEEDENHLVEISEYVKAGVLLIKAELSYGDHYSHTIEQ